eukprot:7109512-Karenia_brevis.AAC.1
MSRKRSRKRRKSRGKNSPERGRFPIGLLPPAQEPLQGPYEHALRARGTVADTFHTNMILI